MGKKLTDHERMFQERFTIWDVLPGRRFGRQWAVHSADLADFATRNPQRGRGRRLSPAPS